MYSKWAPFRALRPHAGAVLLLLALPILTSFLVFCGIVNPDPAIESSGLARITAEPIFPGGAPDWYDGASGAISQPLALLSAHDWLHGIVPWWNPFTGAGMPLAAEMAGFSFFLPFLFLFTLDNGFILFRVAIQIASGLAMYGLLTSLKLDRHAALAGVGLFALNATFFVSPQAIGPLPFLPILLLDVESAVRSASGFKARSWLIIPIAIAYSFYGSFPEVAFFDSLFAGAWIIWRAAGLPAASRWPFLIRISVQILLGIMMTLPLLVPFLSYVKVSALGFHETYFSHATVPLVFAPAAMFPFVYGELNGTTFDNPALHLFHPLNDFGGWFGLPAAFLAIAAWARPGQHRGLISFLSGFIAFFLLRCAGFEPVILLINLIPFVAKTSIIRFCWPSLEAAVFILASLYLDNWIKCGPAPRRFLTIVHGSTAALCIVLLMIAWHYLNVIDFAPGSAQLIFAAIFCFGSILVCVLIGCLTSQAPGTRNVRIAVGLLIGQAFVTFFALQLPAPRAATYDLAGVNYLRKNIGLGKIVSLNGLNWDYPAAYGISALNSFALPVDKLWTNYIHTNLDGMANPMLFIGYPVLPGDDPTQALNEQFQNYLMAGLKYVVTPSNVYPFESRRSLALRHDPAETVTLASGQSVSGTIPASLIGLPMISKIDVQIGTFYGHATGALDLKVCQGTECVKGTIDVARAADDQFSKFVFDHDLMIKPKGVLRYEFTHPAGQPVAIWIYDFDGVAPSNLMLGQEKTGLSPSFEFDLTNRKITNELVFHDDLMNIYEVAGRRAFFSTTPACVINEQNLNNAVVDCPAPARLTRLEAWYPGWQVRVNRVTSTPTIAGGLFQTAALPAGHSKISFFYVPVGTRWSVMAAIAALLIWFMLLWQAKKMPG